MRSNKTLLCLCFLFLTACQADNRNSDITGTNSPVKAELDDGVSAEENQQKQHLRVTDLISAVVYEITASSDVSDFINSLATKKKVILKREPDFYLELKLMGGKTKETWLYSKSSIVQEKSAPGVYYKINSPKFLAP
ncbi:MAG: hypothetical protein ACI93R_003371 [Flavobacteriales bacterium]|jgi:hypothetical protein